MAWARTRFDQYANTAVHEATVLKLGEGLLLEAVRSATRNFPQAALDYARIVVVTTNICGDILPIWLLAGDRMAAAQAQHDAPDITRQSRPNPATVSLSAPMLFEWLAARHGRETMTDAGATIRAATERQLADPATRTADLGGALGIRAFGDAVAGAFG